MDVEGGFGAACLLGDGTGGDVGEATGADELFGSGDDLGSAAGAASGGLFFCSHLSGSGFQISV